MNYDRLLTRVFDKQEKKMLYPGDKIGTDKDVLVAVTNDRLIITGDDYSRFLGFWKFGDRFVPMMCLGNTDKNGKLIYEGDILQEDDYIEKNGDEVTPELILAVISKHSRETDYGEDQNVTHLAPVIVTWDGSGLDVKAPGNDSFRGSIPTNCEIIGNKWEHPEIMEQDE